MGDLNDTVVFVKVVEQGSFTAAARELRLPKSTVSRKVQELEARLGVPMLNRTTRKLGLTEAGQVYFQHCREISRGLEAAENAVAELLDGPRGWLRVAAPPTVAASWIAPLLGEFHGRYPEVQVEMQLTDERLDIIAQGLDLALVAGALPDSSLVARRLATFTTRVYASPAYLRRYGAPARPEELVSHRALALTCHRRGPDYEWQLGDGHSAAGYPIRPLLVCNDASLLHPPLLAGEGLVLACGFSMHEYLAQGAVTGALPGWRGPTFDLNALFPAREAMPPKVRVFIDFLAERLNGHPPGFAAA
jgi:DNA-binding transcriptional LysR family regulator